MSADRDPPQRRPQAFRLGQPEPPASKEGARPEEGQGAPDEAGPGRASSPDTSFSDASRRETPFLERESGHAPRTATRRPRAIDDLAALRLEPDEAIEEELNQGALVPAAPRSRARFSFGKIALGALGALVSLGIGLWIDTLVRDLFARNEWLGWTALALAILLVTAVLGIVAREVVGLMRLGAVTRERQAAEAAYSANDREGAERAIEGLVALLADRPGTAEGRAKMAALDGEVIDGADLLALAERDVLGPLDKSALALVMASAKRTSVVTAVSPKAIVDVAYVLFESVKLIRRMSEHYGARPGTLGLIRLTRDVVAHLAVTGSIAVGDDVIGQVLGHGLAARLSARLGEGIVNGLLTARIGLAAMDLCRPFPFLRTERPKLRAVLGELTSFAARQQSEGKRQT